MSLQNTISDVHHAADAMRARLVDVELAADKDGAALDEALRELAAVGDAADLREKWTALEREQRQPIGSNGFTDPEAVQRLRDALGDVALDWPVPGLARDRLAAKVAATGSRLQRVERQIALLEIERSVAAHLAGMRVGQALDAKRLTEDAGADRATVLNHLQVHERELGCVVDVKSDQIFKVDTRPTIRAAAILWPILAAALGWAILVGLGEIGALKSLKLADHAEVTKAYVLVLGGALVHIIVAAGKVQDVSILPLGRTIEWLQIRWAAVAQTIFSVLVVLIGVKASNVSVADTTDTALLFFSGYATSSLVGVFITRFDSRADTLAKALAGTNR